MAKLEHLKINPHFIDDVAPEVYRSIFETDEVRLLQEKVSQVRGIIDLALQETGVSIVGDSFGDFQTPGALSAGFNVRLPGRIYKRYNEPFTSGVSHTNGKVKGWVHIRTDDTGEFRLNIVRRPLRNSNLSITIPNHPDLLQIPSGPVDSEKTRFTILGISAAAKFARSWEIH